MEFLASFCVSSSLWNSSARDGGRLELDKYLFNVDPKRVKGGGIWELTNRKRSFEGAWLAPDVTNNNAMLLTHQRLVVPSWSAGS